MCPDDRMVRLRLSWFRHAEEVTKKVAKTCRYYGISRPCYYRWLNRYQELGTEGLKDRSRGPHHSPKRTPREIAEKVLYLRRYYHFGPTKIKMYLSRYHDIKISDPTIWRILKQAGVNRLPQNMRYRGKKERYKRYEKALPGHQLQIDVKFLDLTPGQKRRYYQYTAVDDCTRIRVLKIYERNNQANSIRFADYVLSKLPFKVECIQTDNGAEFQQQFHWHLQDQGIQHRHIKPRTPHLNGKVERSHRIDQDEFYRQLEGVVISSVDEFNARLNEWEHFYNYQRPHGSLEGQTPYERLRDKLQSSVAGV